MSITCSSFGNSMQPTATHGRNIQCSPGIKKTHPVCPACNCSSSCCCALRLSLLRLPVNFPKPFLSLSDPSSSLTRPPCIGTNHVVDFYFSSLFLSSQCPASASQLSPHNTRWLLITHRPMTPSDTLWSCAMQVRKNFTPPSLVESSIHQVN